MSFCDCIWHNKCYFRIYSFETKAMKQVIIFIFLVVTVANLHAQYPPMSSPVNIPIILNGNFGEIRSNHFHSGIDIKTNGEIGLPVFSVDDGYVSRISVSPVGYGNALYIDHPSGFTSVYGHLDCFTDTIAQWVKSQQYKEKSFQVNLFPEKDQFKVNKGQEIGKTGNSGSSAGPHLHFEIRKTSQEKPVNPLFFDFDITDTTKPAVENLYVYPLSDSSHVMNKTDKQRYPLVFYGGSYRLKGIQSLDVWGKIGFGIDAIDYFDNNWSKCGIYQMEYWVDNQLINSFEVDELDFNLTRYINSHIDYQAFKENNKGVHKTFIEPGNKLGLYQQTYNGGVFEFKSKKRHKVQIIFYDAHMNASEIIFFVNPTQPIPHNKKESDAHFDFYTDNRFETNDIKVYLPVEALYTDLNFEYKKGTTPAGAFSSLHRIHYPTTPLHVPIDIKIKGENIPAELEEKTLIAIFDIKTGEYTSQGGKYNDGWVETQTRTFGDMCIVADTIAPEIRPLSIDNNKLTEPNRIRFKISDNLSGIKHYEGTIDGKWALFEYDAKRDLLTYYFDTRIKKDKKHKIELVVEDHKQNSSIYTATFFY